MQLMTTFYLLYLLNRISRPQLSTSPLNVTCHIICLVSPDTVLKDINRVIHINMEIFL